MARRRERWQPRERQRHFHRLRAPPNFGNGGTGGCTSSASGGENQSGANLIGSNYAQTTHIELIHFGGAWYGTYTEALALVGNLKVTSLGLVLDGGWAGDQLVELTSATVDDNTVTPPAGGTSQRTCDLPTPAGFLLTKIAETSLGTVQGAMSIQPFDNNGFYRVVDCKYVYNLATSSVPGTGQYDVDVVINGTPVHGAVFGLRSDHALTP